MFFYKNGDDRMSGKVKFTREDGNDFYTGTIEHVPGKTITAPDFNPEPCRGGGLHFGTPEAVIRGVPIPGKVFEVEPVGKVIEIEPGIKKAQTLRVIRELDFPRLLSELANNQSSYVRQEAAWNPNTPEKILSGLAEDGDWWVRRAVAGNPSISEKILSELANNHSSFVRIEVARNPNTPERILLKLTKQLNWWVRRAAFEMLKNNTRTN